MGYKDSAIRRARDRERFRKRTAQRSAKGLCPRCGLTPPAPGRSLCETCAGKRNAASRARDARLRAAGKPRRDSEKAKIYERERDRRQAGERREAGLCVRCGKEPAAPERARCEPCIEKHREADRARYEAGKAVGLLYGGRDVERRRRAARERSRKRLEARRQAGVCLRCGRDRPVEGGTICEPCCQARRERERQLYAERRNAGQCGKCGEPVADGSRCESCIRRETGPAAKKANNARSRRLYMRRRVKHLCVDCGRPAQGACRCEPCAKRSYERSDHFRGMPVFEPSFIVVELATGREHGPFDDPADVALCLAFAKLSRDDVEVISDASPITGLTSWV